MKSEISLLWVLLSFGIGCVHAVSPDHWLPLSIVSWQRSWSWGQIARFAAGLAGVHLSLALIASAVILPWLPPATQDSSFLVAAALVVVMTAARMLRLGRIQEVLRSGAQSRWAFFAMISLLGPAESLVPLVIKAQTGAPGALWVGCLAYGLGTALALFGLSVLGHRVWNRPLRLAAGMQWLLRPTLVLPAGFAVAVGLSALLRFS